MTVYGYTLLSVFLRYSLPLSVYVLKLLVFPKKKKKSNSASSHLKMVSDGIAENYSSLVRP